MPPAAGRRMLGLELQARCAMTFIWFVVWLISNNVGGHEPLLFNPVNAWTGTLILAIALDLVSAHARGGVKR